ncbi:GNAT family N-acetyltransferase [Egibacter rhizosphaerae]|uniref:GNAT family N-acetyltransferase n=1 Tax=Egibacter rhizosphaerae TaxID=1670831 RepID=A0A411YCN8_9ACTN|nr:GNAT family N-acetyltransferase [Egibacter rhizosphaerae]QBI19001.1 GNAT family N-acetyltransferase [Egibacter rhizosphaerae]
MASAPRDPLGRSSAPEARVLSPEMMARARAREPFDTVLRSDEPVHVRPIRPDDRERLREGLTQLSSRSRYLRFHTAVSDLTDAQLRYLTEVDGHDHCAWVVLPLGPSEQGTPGMGVARYVRLANEPETAEAAVTVLDRFQGRGLGTLLLETLACAAVEAGMVAFCNYVLAENTGIRALLTSLGAEEVQVEGAIIRIDLPLHAYGAPRREPGDEPPEAAEPREAAEPAPKRVLRSAAENRLPPLPITSPPFWRASPESPTPAMKWRRPVVPEPDFAGHDPEQSDPEAGADESGRPEAGDERA